MLASFASALQAGENGALAAASGSLTSIENVDTELMEGAESKHKRRGGARQAHPPVKRSHAPARTSSSKKKGK